MSRNSRRAQKAPQARKRGSKPQAGKNRKKRNIFQNAMRKLWLFVLRIYKYITRQTGNGRTVVISAGICLTILVFSLSVYNLVRKNAYAIYVGETQAAIIKMTKEDISGELQKQAVLRIENSIGTNIQVNEEITFIPVHASKKEMVGADEAIQKISQTMTYKVEAFSISVEGTQMAILKSQSEANKVEEAIIKPYLHEGVKIVESGFVEDYKVEKIYVEQDELTDIDKALRILTSTLETAESYTVVSGDNLDNIAVRFGMTLSALLEINPNKDVRSILQIGETLNLTVDKPIVSVRTVEERKYIDVEPKPVQTLLNPNEKSSYKKTIQYGTLGQAEVIQHVVRINGMETETIVVERNIILAATPEIIEVGTK